MQLFALLAILASAVAFAPMKVQTRVAHNMEMKMVNPLKNLVIPAAIAPFFAPLATIAAEGTGRAFGFDDGRVIVAACLPIVVIMPLYLNWASQQEGDDFFDGYEKRRNG